MSHDVPDFSKLVANYPNFRSSDAVKRMIGGGVAKTIGDPQFENTCTIRISRDLNYAGVHIPAGYPHLATMPGGDKLHYAFRVAEMRAFLIAKFGAPDIEVKGPSVPRDQFAGVRGIIEFQIPFTDGPTGHFDLWDGKTFHDEIYKISLPTHDFFDMARVVSLWKAPGSGELGRPPDM